MSDREFTEVFYPLELNDYSYPRAGFDCGTYAAAVEEGKRQFNKFRIEKEFRIVR